MPNKNTPQTVSARRDDLNPMQEHLSIEAYHKLNRASAVSQFVGGDLLRRELNGLHQLYLPQIFSYIHEDVSYVLEELKAKGLCRDFLTTTSGNGGEHYV
ncbi:Derepression protein [Salmonella enterica subsp. enterica serovar Javiana]|nr:Derepression protein [Salmonella enterica]EDN4768608.1 Derepression protein [Salmonella enterica subsp. enterica serovar Javiana]EDS5709760.1 Derepression protein [Salmonella enterica subsp. enterica serovar Javiana]EDU1442371.1 Derepression protein [Salmonella enterica subsp. enterica serovar Javiana]EEH0584284.1 Derepression protein [Salmonella enterica]